MAGEVYTDMRAAMEVAEEFYRTPPPEAGNLPLITQRPCLSENCPREGSKNI